MKATRIAGVILAAVAVQPAAAQNSTDDAPILLDFEIAGPEGSLWHGSTRISAARTASIELDEYRPFVMRCEGHPPELQGLDQEIRLRLGIPYDDPDRDLLAVNFFIDRHDHPDQFSPCRRDRPSRRVVQFEQIVPMPGANAISIDAPGDYTVRIRRRR